MKWLNALVPVQRVTDGEIRQAVRATGRGDLSSIAAVVLESDGTMSVVSVEQRGDARRCPTSATPDADVPAVRQQEAERLGMRLQGSSA